jgi:hypothetical protein
MQGEAARIILSTAPASVEIGFVENDQETTALSLQLQKIFVDAGWQVSLVAGTYSGSLLFGVFLGGTDPQKIATVR